MIALAAAMHAPPPESPAIQAGVASAWAVVSNVANVTGRPQANTTARASGSFQALNSASGVTLPSAQAPVISTISAMRSSRAGSVARTRPRLVAGPTPTRVISPGAATRSRSRMASAAIPGAAGLPSGRVTPPTPFCPCTRGSGMKLPSIGRSAPPTTGTSRPVSETKARALRSVCSSPTLPPTAVTIRTSNSGLASARNSAMALSVPGSQSMMILRGLMRGASVTCRRCRRVGNRR